MIHNTKLVRDFLISITLFIIIWYLYCVIFNIPTFILPNPAETLQEMIFILGDNSFWIHMGHTLLITLLGFITAVLFGVILGFILYNSEKMYFTFMPFIVFFQGMPKIALIPLFTIWFGLGVTSKLFITFTMAFFPILVSTLDALKLIPKNFYDLFTVLNASKLQKMTKLELRYILPWLFGASKVAIIQAIIGATVSEWMAGQYGLGYLQVYASSTFNTPLLLASIIYTIIMGLILYPFISMLESRFEI